MKLKGKKIEILAQIATRDNEGVQHHDHVSRGGTFMGIFPAYFRQMSGKEAFAAVTINYKEDVSFQMNYRTDLTIVLVARYNGIPYDIIRIDVFEGYEQDLNRYCTRRARQIK